MTLQGALSHSFAACADSALGAVHHRAHNPAVALDQSHSAMRAIMASIATQQITDTDRDQINAVVKQVRAEIRVSSTGRLDQCPYQVE